MIHLQPWSISARSSSSDRSREGGSGGSGGATTDPSTASTPPPLSPTLRRTMTGEPAPLWRQVYAGLRMAGVDGFGPSDPEVRSQRDLFSLLEGKRILLLLDGVDAYQGRWRHRRSPALALDPTPAPRPTPPPPAAVEGVGIPGARRGPATGGAAATQRQRQQTRFVEPQRGHMRRERSAIPRTDRLAVPDSMQRSRSAAAATDEYDIWKFFNTLGRKTNGVKVLFTSVSSEGTMPDIRYPIKSIEMSPLSRREMANILVQNLSSSIVVRWPAGFYPCSLSPQLNVCSRGVDLPWSQQAVGKRALVEWAARAEWTDSMGGIPQFAILVAASMVCVRGVN